MDGVHAPVAFIDTETLGLEPDIHPVWEIGLILPNGTEYLWQLRVTDRDIALAQPQALEISRFHERYGPTFAWRRDTVYEILVETTKGLHLAGAVVSFDEERLRRSCQAMGLQPAWHYHLVDVEALAGGKLGLQPPWDSDELTARLGVKVDPADKHTALGDARWAKALYEAVFS